MCVIHIIGSFNINFFSFFFISFFRTLLLSALFVSMGSCIQKKTQMVNNNKLNPDFTHSTPLSWGSFNKLVFCSSNTLFDWLGPNWPTMWLNLRSGHFILCMFSKNNHFLFTVKNLTCSSVPKASLNGLSMSRLNCILTKQ